MYRQLSEMTMKLSGKKVYAENMIWLFADKMVRIFGGLVIGVWVARYLGPENYGIFNYAIAFSAFFSFLSDLGLNAIVVRELTKKNINYGYLMGTAFGLKLFGALIMIFVCSIAAFSIKRNEPVVMWGIIVYSLSYLFHAFDVIDYNFQSNVLSKYTVIARNLSFVITSLIKIVFIILHFSVICFITASIIEIAISGLTSVLIYSRINENKEKWKIDRKLSKVLLKNSWPLMLSMFLITIYVKIDQVMIDAFLDITKVGIYSVAVRLCTSWYFVPALITTTFMPYFIKLKETNINLFNKRLMQIQSAIIWLGITVGIGTMIFGKIIIIKMFGYEYIEAYTALSLNIWAGIFVSLGYISNFWVISGNLQIYRMVGAIISVSINVIGNYLLIPKFGITGAAMSTLGTQIIATWFAPLIFKEIRGYIIMSIKALCPVYLLGIKK